MDFESSTGTSLQEIVDRIQDKDLTELASELRSAENSQENSREEKPEPSEPNDDNIEKMV